MAWNDPETLRAYYARYRAKNRAKLQTRQHAWYLANKDRQLLSQRERRAGPGRAEACRDYQRRYYLTHATEIKAKVKARRAAYRHTPEGRAAQARENSRRRASQADLPCTLTATDRAELLEGYNYACAYCGVAFSHEKAATWDHVIPLLLGGPFTKDNVVPACRSCNSSKRAKLVAGFIPVAAIW